MNEIRPPKAPADDSQPDLGLAEAPPTVIVAPELRGRRDLVVIREPDETDADYQAPCDLVALLLGHAEKAWPHPLSASGTSYGVPSRSASIRQHPVSTFILPIRLR